MVKPHLAIDTETSGLDLYAPDFQVWMISFADDTHSWSYNHEDFDVQHIVIQRILDSYTCVFHNSSYDIPVLQSLGYRIGAYQDTLIMSYLVDPQRESHSLQSWGAEFNYPKLDFKDFSKYSKDMRLYGEQDTRLTMRLYRHLDPLLSGRNRDWYERYELPYSAIIRTMERVGFIIDTGKTTALHQRYSNEAGRRLQTIARLAPYAVPRPDKDTVTYKRGYHTRCGVTKWNHCNITPFNPGSHDQVARLLSSYGWVPTKFTETGQASTDRDVLAKLDYPIAKELTAYADYTKAISTYLEPFLRKSTRLTDNLGILRGNFNQTATVTGRLSSSNPNLQNIWTKGPIGRDIRSCIVAPPGYAIVDIDLSNIEARVLAHYLSKTCGYSQLADTFARGEDFHQLNADTWGVDRPTAKTVLYAILYGAGPAKLATSLGKSVAESKRILGKVNKNMPAIQELKDRVWHAARKRGGQVYTCMGRRLYYPNINSEDKGERGQSERQVFNALLQGGAADILKVLQCRAVGQLPRYTAVLVASIHDESLHYCPERQAPDLAAYLNELYASDTLLSHCPVRGDAKIGKSWYEVH